MGDNDDDVAGSTTYRQLFRQGAECCQVGDYRKAFKFFCQCLQEQQRLAHPNSDHLNIVAHTIKTMGIAQERLGNYKYAMKLLEDSLTLYHQIHGDTTPTPCIAATLHCMGWVLYQQQEHDHIDESQRAVELYTNALNMFRTLYGADTKRSEVAAVVRNLGRLYTSMRQPELAEQYLLEALYMYQEDNRERAKTYEYIGLLSKSIGKYDLAGRYLTAAINMHLALQRSNNEVTLIRLASCYAEQAAILKLQKKQALAVDMLEKALGAFEIHHKDSLKHAEVAALLTRLGKSQGRLGHIDMALVMYEGALAIYLSVRGDDATSVKLAGTFEYLALAHILLRQPRIARHYYDAALAVYYLLYGRRAMNFDVARILQQKGKTEEVLGNYAEALAWYKDALVIQRHLLGPKSTSHTMDKLVRKINELLTKHMHTKEKALPAKPLPVAASSAQECNVADRVADTLEQQE